MKEQGVNTNSFPSGEKNTNSCLKKKDLLINNTDGKKKMHFLYSLGSLAQLELSLLYNHGGRFPFVFYLCPPAAFPETKKRKGYIFLDRKSGAVFSLLPSQPSCKGYSSNGRKQAFAKHALDESKPIHRNGMSPLPSVFYFFFFEFLFAFICLFLFFFFFQSSHAF